MSQTMTIEFGEHAAREVRDLAEVLHQTPDNIVATVVEQGLQRVRRYAELKRGAETVDVESVIQMLRSKRNDNPPDPGDEIPDDLKEWVESRRAARRP